jgi:hypothetical protein
VLPSAFASTLRANVSEFCDGIEIGRLQWRHLTVRPARLDFARKRRLHSHFTLISKPDNARPLSDVFRPLTKYWCREVRIRY